MWAVLAKQIKDPRQVNRVVSIRFRGFDNRPARMAQRCKLSMDLLDIDAVGPTPLPTRRKFFSLSKSPFKWGRHKDQWESLVHAQIVTFQTDVFTSNRLLKYIKEHMYPGCDMRIRKFQAERLDKFYVDPYLKQVDTSVNIEESHKQALLDEDGNWMEHDVEISVDDVIPSMEEYFEEREKEENINKEAEDEEVTDESVNDLLDELSGNNEKVQ
eukprot:TRINITY_DN776_c0_g4_i1.p1 TRINITY_DN776_c0_g4~~TRINITY_DN776_c0_g4_i1.p1  ORF type:complete len:214 (+),score=47.81 TRINITY_DN776_c0_g4_i1:65-706(+)